jgi:hypothetical protein
MHLSTKSTLRRAAGVAIACVLGVACSGKKNVQPDAFVNAMIGPGSGNAAVCGNGSSQTVVQIGEPTQPEPQTYSNGQYQNGTVTIECRVDQSGSQFNVQLFAEVDGPSGGSMSATGTVNPSTGQSSVSASFTSPSLGSTFAQTSNCTLTFSYNNMSLTGIVSGSPIADGRIWGHLSCPNAQQSGTQESTDDGGYTERTCDAEVDFLFQNCN